MTHSVRFRPDHGLEPSFPVVVAAVIVDREVDEPTVGRDVNVVVVVISGDHTSLLQ